MSFHAPRFFVCLGPITFVDFFHLLSLLTINFMINPCLVFLLLLLRSSKIHAFISSGNVILYLYTVLLQWSNGHTHTTHMKESRKRRENIVWAKNERLRKQTFFFFRWMFFLNIFFLFGFNCSIFFFFVDWLFFFLFLAKICFFAFFYCFFYLFN